ncbi:hypothetical protein NC651_032017 [Populus alba x Populus x berolinensis]|nr:hypothetical protein NC651_032017 [Populus alba x Populus x berolinensis]
MITGRKPDKILVIGFNLFGLTNTIESNRNGSFQHLNDFKTVCCEYSLVGYFGYVYCYLDVKIEADLLGESLNCDQSFL